MSYTAFYLSVRKLNNDSIFLKITGTISRTTSWILGLFVLIWMHFFLQNPNMAVTISFDEIFSIQKCVKNCETGRETHTLILMYENQTLATFSKNNRGCLKNHLTDTRLICTHLEAFFMLNLTIVKISTKKCWNLLILWPVVYTKHLAVKERGWRCSQSATSKITHRLDLNEYYKLM